MVRWPAIAHSPTRFGSTTCLMSIPGPGPDGQTHRRGPKILRRGREAAHPVCPAHVRPAERASTCTAGSQGMSRAPRVPLGPRQRLGHPHHRGAARRAARRSSGPIAILDLLKAHAKGLVPSNRDRVSGTNCSTGMTPYLETSATAIYVYSLARAINRGWLDPLAYAPATLLGWNASDQSEKPGRWRRLRGYGHGLRSSVLLPSTYQSLRGSWLWPALLAGAEVINLLKSHTFEINDSSLQLTQKK